jgi:hypothetical protein
MTTVPPPTPITTDLTPEWIAAIIDHAADLIHLDGLEVGGYWACALLQRYEPGFPCCVVGALAVACGYLRKEDVEATFVGLDYYDPKKNAWVATAPHPVLAAVMAELGFQEIEHLYDWSDNAWVSQVVEDLRGAAQKIRARGAVA